MVGERAEIKSHSVYRGNGLQLRLKIISTANSAASSSLSGHLTLIVHPPCHSLFLGSERAVGNMSKPDIIPDTTISGIAVDPRTLERVVPESRRPDGS